MLVPMRESDAPSLRQAVKIDQGFYERPTLEVAHDLIGKVLVRRLGRSLLRGQIVETEAYIGQEDLACHASKGRTERTEVMFGPSGHAYVYMIYGMHCCLNVVTEPEGFAAAVLIRAIEPLEGLPRMRRNRRGARAASDLGSGPGKLCQAMEIDRRLNAASLSESDLWIEDRGRDPGIVLASPRIGVDYAGVWKDKPWRFFSEGNAHVSRNPLNRSGSPAR